MRRILVVLSVVMAISSVALGQTKSKKTDHGMNKSSGVEATLMQIEREWAKVTLARDTVGLDRILASDYIYTDADAHPITKAEFLASLTSGEATFAMFTVDDMQVRVYGDAAVVLGQVVLKGRYKGQAIDERDRFTDTFVKRGGRWQAVATHTSRMAQP